MANVELKYYQLPGVKRSDEINLSKPQLTWMDQAVVDAWKSGKPVIASGSALGGTL
jgi:hypothetical protein